MTIRKVLLISALRLFPFETFLNAHDKDQGPTQEVLQIQSKESSQPVIEQLKEKVQAEIPEIILWRTLTYEDLGVMARFNVKKINSWAEIDTDSINTQTLVVTDIDQTLIQPSDSLAWNYDFGARAQARTAISTALKIYPKLSQYDIFREKVFCDKNSELIEQACRVVIANLRAKKVGVLACSTCSSEPTFAKLRAKRLEELKIELGLPTCYQGEKANNAFKYWNGRPWFKKPIFYSNIIYTDHVDAKGEMIGAFLDAACPKGSHPKAVVFIDDLIHNHVSVAKECARRDIKFQGYFYCRIKKINWNLDMVMFQLKYLADRGVWLRDSVAQYLYNKRE